MGKYSHMGKYPLLATQSTDLWLNQQPHLTDGGTGDRVVQRLRELIMVSGENGTSEVGEEVLISMRLRREVGEEVVIIGSHEIAELVQKFMSPDGEESKGIDEEKKQCTAEDLQKSSRRGRICAS
ncbi:hypothetical protein H6P81_007757 [Aristolochia fimbriata]|uniref:Uncharacterized protein n=1 Tax=Aristolochia fimbriata TaxID=158543 RepID=A0AAV7F1D1_ARIFI|nr:hypothetical protein H6P81_007757 [Aristolochia fimbriata]